MFKKIKEGANQIKEEICTKATAVVGIAAIMGLAVMLGMQQKSGARRR